MHENTWCWFCNGVVNMCALFWELVTASDVKMTSIASMRLKSIVETGDVLPYYRSSTTGRLGQYWVKQGGLDLLPTSLVFYRCFDRTPPFWWKNLKEKSCVGIFVYRNWKVVSHICFLFSVAYNMNQHVPSGSRPPQATGARQGLENSIRQCDRWMLNLPPSQ